MFSSIMIIQIHNIDWYGDIMVYYIYSQIRMYRNRRFSGRVSLLATFRYWIACWEEET